MSKFTGRDIKIGIGKEKITGTASVLTASSLEVTSGSPFTSSMVGAQVVNTTDKTYSYVTAYVNDNKLTLNDDIFLATPKAYEVAAPRGTAVAPEYWIPRRSFDFDDKVLAVNDEQGYGVIEDAVGSRVVAKWAEGSIIGAVRDKSLGLLLLNFFGKLTSTVQTGNDDEAYIHVFTIRSNHQHPCFTLAVKDDLEGLAYPLAMLKSLKITADLGEIILFTAELLAKKGETATPVLTAAYVAENDFAAQDISVKFASATTTLTAATATKVKSVEITLEGDVEKDDILSSSDPDDILNKTIMVSVDVKKVYDVNTFKGYYTAGTGRAMRITIENGTTLLQTGGALYPKLEIDLNEVKITDWSTNKDLAGIVEESFTVKAMFKVADAEMIQATLQNVVTHY